MASPSAMACVAVRGGSGRGPQHCRDVVMSRSPNRLCTVLTCRAGTGKRHSARDRRLLSQSKLRREQVHAQMLTALHSD